MSRCLLIFLISILGLPARPAVAQSTSFQAPIAGFIYRQSSRSIRPLMGLPGAIRVGAPVLKEVDFAAVGPNGMWAFLTRDGRSFFVRGLADLAPTEVSTDGIIDAVDRVVWNRDGSFALLYSSTANRLQRVHLSVNGPVPDTALDLSPWGSVAALAIDPAGSQVAFGVAGSGLYLFAVGQTPALLSTMSQPVAAAFDGAGRRLYAIDLDQNQISEFDSGSSALAFASLVQPDAPSVAPVGLAVSADGRYLLLPDGAARAVRVYETATGNLVNTIPLDFAPSRFELLSADPTFLLNGDNTNEWLLILSAGQLPSISFVPAYQEEVQ